MGRSKVPVDRREGAHGVDEGWDGDHGVGRVEITADQEPADPGPEAPTAKTPLVQLIEITGAPSRRKKPSIPPLPVSM